MSDDDLNELLQLKKELDRNPRDAALWTSFANRLHDAGRLEEAIAAFRTALELVQDRAPVEKLLIPLLRRKGDLAEALIRAEKLLATGDDAHVRIELARILLLREDLEGARQHYLRAISQDDSLQDDDLDALCWGPGETNTQEPPEKEKTENPADAAAGPAQPMAAEVAPDVADLPGWARQFEWNQDPVTFADVAGLDEIKKQIHLRILAPFKNPEIYKAFGRKGGGGILMYGPPGCGKTFLARATAGECGARFMAAAIHEVVDKYWGESEKLVHALFEEARRYAPTVLFFDEFDALGSRRGHHDSQFWRTLVDQMLQEMDGFAGRNTNVLIFAATNNPWNVDMAFRRPGRFDRVLFVPPPDEPARAQILRTHLAGLPGGDSIPVAKLARDTDLMTGADLKALCERASESALSRSLDSGKVHPVTPADFERSLREMQNSASEWLATARNYARYSNEGGQYDDLMQFLKRIKRW